MYQRTVLRHFFLPDDVLNCVPNSRASSQLLQLYSTIP